MKIEVILQSAPLSLPPVTVSGCGAVVRFDGVVRSLENGRTITGLFYEAYQPMAEETIEAILQKLQAKYPFHLARVHHRLGWVPVGEAAISMDIYSPHRGEAFSALVEFMDAIKQEVPIWKNCSVSVLPGDDNE
jgi:molybdopterin synthase catalytic subunit